MYGVTPTAVLVFVFCCALIVLSFIDYDFYIIPNVISLPGTAIGVGIAAINQFFGIFSYPVVGNLTESFFGFLMGAGFLFIISEVYMRLRKKEGLGMGDVKLLAMVGVTFGAPAALSTIFIGSLLGAIFGLLLIVVGGRRFSQPLPFGPYLAFGTVIHLFAGDHIIAALGTPYASLLTVFV
jgi:leader peptidase (prepilin peptidase)/N-methyltransferase